MGPAEGASLHENQARITQRTTERIPLKLDLVKKPPDCAEYLVVHESVQPIERRLNESFSALMEANPPERLQQKKALDVEPPEHDGLTD